MDVKIRSQAKDLKEDLGIHDMIDDQAESDPLRDVSINFDQEPNMHDVIYGTPYFPVLRRYTPLNLRHETIVEGTDLLSWTTGDESTLLRMRRIQRMSFGEIARALKRTEESVACKYLKLVPLCKRTRSTNSLFGAQVLNSRLKEPG
jgi:hypothetical protein